MTAANRTSPSIWIGASGYIFFLALMIGCGQPPGKNGRLPDIEVWHGQTMGTTYQVKVSHVSLSTEQHKQIGDAIDNVLTSVNDRMSTYDPNSEISQFNASPSSKPFPVSFETALVVSEALWVHHKSQGSFDITVGSLVDLWGFGPNGRRSKLPSEEEIRQALAKVGSEKIQVAGDVAPQSITKYEPGLRIDLSAIAKGYAADRVSRILLERKLRNHLVEIGGEMVARGNGPHGRVWRVGIESPSSTADSPREYERVVELSDASLATSGNYRNYGFLEGKRYSHTIDPTTGRPVTHQLASATVVAPTCMRADALATAVMVLGPERGLAFLEGLDGIEGFFFVSDGHGGFGELKTKGMEQLLLPSDGTK